eukprot:scaffold656_cov403-Pavlova_lutheri.AAC.42
MEHGSTKPFHPRHVLACEELPGCSCSLVHSLPRRRPPTPSENVLPLFLSNHAPLVPSGVGARTGVVDNSGLIGHLRGHHEHFTCRRHRRCLCLQGNEGNESGCSLQRLKPEEPSSTGRHKAGLKRTGDIWRWKERERLGRVSVGENPGTGEYRSPTGVALLPIPILKIYFPRTRCLL